jgi:hypothetical protein
VALLTSNLMMSELLQLSPTPRPGTRPPLSFFGSLPVTALGILTSSAFEESPFLEA